jgi:hypothetical protein
MTDIDLMYESPDDEDFILYSRVRSELEEMGVTEPVKLTSYLQKSLTYIN